MELPTTDSLKRWLTFDADASWSAARYSEPILRPVRAGGRRHGHLGRRDGRQSASDIWRLAVAPFWPARAARGQLPALEGDEPVRAQIGDQLAKKLRLTAECFNLLNSAVSDVDYYFVSRLPGESLNGVADVMTHPALSRSARINMAVGF